MKEQSGVDAERIDRALAYIDEHALERPRLEEIAAAAGLSPSYFHHRFRAAVGEPVAAYAQRRLLARAAWQLIHRPGTSVTEIAMEHGFCAHSDFSRAFRAVYGVSPQGFRREAERGSLEAVVRRPSRSGPRLDAPPFQPFTRDFGELRLAYIRCLGLSGERKSRRIEEAFARLYRRLSALGQLTERTMVLGCTVDPPETLALDRCRYYACMTIEADFAGEGEIGVGALRTAGAYAGVDLGARGGDPADAFFGACDFLARHWIPERGLELDDRPAIEVFDSGDGAGRRWEVYLPVSGKARNA